MNNWIKRRMLDSNQRYDCQFVCQLSSWWFRSLTQSSNFGNNIFTNLIADENQYKLLTKKHLTK